MRAIDTRSGGPVAPSEPVPGAGPGGAAAAAHAAFMALALEEARAAGRAGEVPVGAVVVLDGRVIGRGRNAPILTHDPTAHAEVVALRDAGRRLANYRLPGATLYATIEPCVMCVGACLQARVARVVFGAEDPKAGALVSRVRLLDRPLWTHQIEVVGGVGVDEARQLMQEFFRVRREEGYRSGRTGLDSKSSWGR